MEQEIEDLEITREIPNIDYEVGDHVVYPHHGAGKVLKKEPKVMLGERRDYLTIQILHNDMTVMVPCENAGRAGLRRVIGEEAVAKVLSVLRDEAVISNARASADKVVSDDPELVRHPALAAVVASLLATEQASYLEKS